MRKLYRIVLIAIVLFGGNFSFASSENEDSFGRSSLRLPTPRYEVNKNIVLGPGQLTFEYYAPKHDLKVKGEITLTNMTYNTIANQKEIEKAVADYQYAGIKRYQGTVLYDKMKKEIDNTHRINNRGSNEKTAVVIGTAVIKTSFKQETTESGVVKSISPITIECPFKCSLADADISRGQYGIMPGAEISDIVKQASQNADVTATFEFEFKRTVTYEFRRRIGGSVYKSVNGQSSVAKADTENYEKYPLEDTAEKNSFDLSELLMNITSFGQFKDATTLSLIATPKKPQLSFMKMIKQSSKGDDGGYGQIVAKPEWPRSSIGIKIKKKIVEPVVEEDMSKYAGKGSDKSNGVESEEQDTKPIDQTKEKINQKKTKSVTDKLLEMLADIAFKLTKWHYEDRDAKNKDLPKYDEIAFLAQWQRLPQEQAGYHQNGKGKPELKYIHKDGREVVYDGDTHEIVTDPKYKGTYNYCNPALIPNPLYKIIYEYPNVIVTFTYHYIFDMAPYYLGGNTRGEY